MRRAAWLISAALLLAQPADAQQLMLLGAGRPAASGSAGCANACNLGTFSSGGVMTGVVTTATDCAAGQLIVVYGGVQSEDPTTLFTNSAGLTFTISSQGTNAGTLRTRMYRTLLASTLTAGATFTMNRASTAGVIRFGVACLNVTAHNLGLTKSSGTNPAPGATSSTMTGQPQYFYVGATANTGGFDSGGTSGISGYTQIFSANGTIGPKLWYRDITSANGNTETFSVTNYDTAQGWDMVYGSGTHP